MSKFSSRPDSGKGRSGSRSDKRPRRTTDTEEKKEYKAKRSFTKNKSFRDTKDAGGDRPRKSFSGSDERKPFKKDFGGEKSYGDKPKRSFGDRDDKKSFGKERYSDKPKRVFGDKDERPKKSFGDRDDKKSFGKDSYSEKPKREFKERKSFNDRDDKGSFGKDQFSERPRRDFKERDERKSSRDGDERPRRDFDERSSRSEDVRPRRKSEDVSDKKSYKKTIKTKDDKFAGFKKATGKYANSPDRSDRGDKPVKRRLTKPRKADEGEFTKRVKHDEFEEGKAFTPQASREKFGDKRSKKPAPVAKQTGADGLIRLNKYLSNAGVASRRDADNLIISGAVKVNGVVVDQVGTKVSPTDKITYGDAAVRAERKVYLLLNKPKDYITTVDDPKERKTVMELVKGACRERIYPVGRLDRNTTGLLLFTNDGEMTTKLTHPKHGVKKIYQVSLNKGLKPEDFKMISEGLELEDGIVKADDLAFVGEGKKEVGIEIHSGRNRIVRRIFEHLGYDVLKLDRVVFAGLTKKDLPRGKHRFLTAKEISFLQMIG
ncbi:pseudouridylate synthase [Sphingobacteriaceae bacterium]|nr:pseudouridylate synthase [Sphingobacteriaceae bacterium]